MPKYLMEASYTTEGTKGLLKDGGSKRRAEMQRLTESLGERLEAFYYALGGGDAIAIVDIPDQVTAAAVALGVKATGAVSPRTTVLLTPEEIDQASQKTVSYRPPGQ